MPGNAMRRLEGKEACAHAIYLSEAAEAAAYSLCLKARCGAAIVKDGQVITTGYNAPPDKKRPDYCLKERLPEGFKSDRHCCIHAEAEAIWQALLNHENIRGGTMYFTRATSSGVIIPSGKPYCTKCSKDAIRAGIEAWVLLHPKDVWGKEGLYLYDAQEYNRISYEQAL
jgi:dCMP deaminase